MDTEAGGGRGGGRRSGAGADSASSFLLALDAALEALVPFLLQPWPLNALRFGLKDAGLYGRVGDSGLAGFSTGLLLVWGSISIFKGSKPLSLA